jgi:hypothetical protein
MSQNIQELKTRTRDAGESADLQMLSNVWNEQIFGLMCVESQLILTLKSDKWQNLDSPWLCPTNYITVYSLPLSGMNLEV